MSSTSPPPFISVTLLGEPAWSGSDGRRGVLSSKDAALLAILALDGPKPRAVVCALLWPDATAQQAAASLRQRASRLHRRAGQSVIETGERVRLGTRTITDIEAIDTFGSDRLLSCGDLLAGVDLGTWDELDRWLQGARARINERRAHALAEHAEAMLRDGQLHAALPLASRIVELTPMVEHAWRRLMRLHYLRGDRAAAMATFERLKSALMLELGTGPSAETARLWRTIETSGQAGLLPRQPVPTSVMLPPLLVGRGEAWQAMAAAWQQGRPFVLIGEAGMGKSRLLDDFVRGLEGVVADRARPGDERTPYAVLGRVLAMVDERHSTDLPELTRRELARVNPCFGTPWPAKARTDVLRDAMERFLCAAVAGGLRAIVVDDMHASDMASLEAFRWAAVSPRLSGLRFACGTRPPRTARTAELLDQWLDDSQPPVRVPLMPLSRDDLAALLASLALPALVDPAVTERLYRHAGGHPLFTLATLQHVLMRGDDLRRPALPDPPSVQTLLDSRLRELPPSAHALLHVAAIAGVDLTAERAANLIGCRPLDLTEPWLVLEAANVLRGDAFTHDLVREAALRRVPRGVRLALHRQLGALLANDPAAGPGRVAWHCEHGELWAEAGRCWHAAGAAARQAGRLVEQAELFLRAAHCYQRAGDMGARFEALFARLDGMLLRHGAAAVLAELPAVEELADNDRRRLRCRLARADALIDCEQARLAAAEAAIAMQEAVCHPDLAADACATQAWALAQCHEFDVALAAAQLAIERATALDNQTQLLRATNALAYVHYARGDLAAAVPLQRDAVMLAERVGDVAEAAAAEGHVAALLASIGDVPGTHAHALRAQARHEAIGLGDNSTLGSVNHIVLGAAAACLGRFDESLLALQRAVAMTGPDAATAARAKARLTLGNLWLTLGRPDAARATADELPPDMLPGMRMQAAFLMARAAALDGLPARRHWQELARLAVEHSSLPLVQSAWYELSFQGDAAQAIAQLARVRAECVALGLDGTARTLQLRELARWLELDGLDATVTAREHADALMPHIESGLSAKCYPPEAWLTLAAAFARVGEQFRHARCLELARRWVARAILSVPPEHRKAFQTVNPINRELLRIRGAGD